MARSFGNTEPTPGMRFNTVRLDNGNPSHMPQPTYS
jgi:hypothetical protein